MATPPKIIVLDDDPTGSQTVHSCLLLTQWDVDTLRLGLRDESPIFFVLTNTRSLPPKQAAAVTREVCHNLKPALAAENIEDFLIVSRSDSTRLTRISSFQLSLKADESRVTAYTI